MIPGSLMYDSGYIFAFRVALKFIHRPRNRYLNYHALEIEFDIRARNMSTRQIRRQFSLLLGSNHRLQLQALTMIVVSFAAF
jgi:hypothetical protein